MTNLHVKHVIVGAGAMGCATACHLARRGEPFLLIEQFPLGHDRGSSHGEARIIRHSYSDPTYASLMPQAFREWRDLEALGGQNLYLRTGGVSLGPPGASYVKQVAATLAEIGCPHRLMAGEEWNRNAPSFRVPEDYEALFEPDAGVLSAARALRLQVDLAKTLGGNRTQVWDDHPVLRIDLEGDLPAILTASHRVTTDRLIVTAGPWTGRLFPDLQPRLSVERQEILYLNPATTADYQPGRFPVFIFMGEPSEEAYYGMPDLSGQGVKVARHGGIVAEPDNFERSVSDEAIGGIRKFLGTCLPGLAEAPVQKTEVCKYTMAPGDHFLVDFAPERKDVLIASPCSGHGFKFSPLMGRMLADLAVEGSSPIHSDRWRIS